MINEWLTGKEFIRLTNISESTLMRLKRRIKKEHPEFLKMEDGNNKLHKSLLREFSSDYFVDFHDFVCQQLRSGRKIESLDSLYGLFLIGREWTLFCTFTFKDELPAQTCINRVKRTISNVMNDYPKIEGFYVTERNKGREKGFHVHCLLNTPNGFTKDVKRRLENKGYSSRKQKNIDVKEYKSSKLGAGYVTKELTNNPDGYGFL